MLNIGHDLVDVQSCNPQRIWDTQNPWSKRFLAGQVDRRKRVRDISLCLELLICLRSQRRNSSPAARFLPPSVTLIKYILLLILSVTQYVSAGSCSGDVCSWPPTVLSRMSQVPDIQTLSPPLEDTWSCTGFHWWKRASSMRRKWACNGSYYDPHPPSYLEPLNCIHEEPSCLSLTITKWLSSLWCKRYYR